MTRTALILAAHGSRQSPQANRIIQDWTALIQNRLDQQRAAGNCLSRPATQSQPVGDQTLGESFDLVLAAFNQGAPRFCEVLDILPGIGRAVVVPVMTSEGYFAHQFLPGELNKNRRAGDVSIHITRPLGCHPAISEIVATRIENLSQSYQLDLGRTTILIVGHGAGNTPHSSRATRELCDRMTDRVATAAVRPAFLDQRPFLQDAFQTVATENVLVIPFLISPGPHATIDIPNRLGLSAGDPAGSEPIRAATVRERSGHRRASTSPTVLTSAVYDKPRIYNHQRRQIIIDRPVGMDHRMIQCIIELADSGATALELPGAHGVRKTLRIDSQEQAKTGCVYLVGAGPGDPELITVRGAKLLHRADVILFDRLVDLRVLDYAKRSARRIDVGKPSHDAHTTQQHINQTIVRLAREGKCVVRLKGGDPFVFGRGFEELLACRQAQVPCHVICGVTSAIAAPSSAEIALTHRRLARSVAIVTAASAAGDDSHLDFESLARMDTLVVLMGRARIRRIAASLIASGKSPQTPAACIANATTPQQRTLRAELATIADRMDESQIKAPVVIVIGEVAGLTDINSELSKAWSEANVDRATQSPTPPRIRPEIPV